MCVTLKLFGFDEHVHQIDESEDAQDKETCKHRASDLFEPIHTFKEKPVAGPAYHTQKNKRHKFIFQHLKILLVLILFIVSPFYIPTVCQTDKKLREEKNISKLKFQLKSRSRWPPFHFEKVTFPEWKSSLFRQYLE